MDDTEKLVARDLLIQISSALAHLSQALGNSYTKGDRITQDEKIALLASCACAGDSLKKLAMITHAIGSPQ